MKGSQLKAVHDDDLMTLLMSLGLLDKLRDGHCSCHFCHQVITLENLGAIIPISGEIAFSCDAPSCLNLMVESGD